MLVWRSKVVFCALLLGLTQFASAATATYVVTVNTSSLSGKTGSLDFNFNPGPLVTQSASVQISNFSSDGTPQASPTLAGDATGALPASLSFNNAMGLNDYFQGFTFGSTLSFQVILSGAALTSPDGVSTSGSSFAFSIFSDAAGTMPALTSDTTNGFGFIVNVNLDGSTTVIDNETAFAAIQILPVLAVTPSASTIAPGEALNTTVAVNGGTAQPTPTGSVTLSSGSYTSAATALSSGSATISIPAGSLATGTDTLTATYTGDTSYYKATATSSVIVAQLPPAVSLTPSAQTITVVQPLSVTIAIGGGTGNPTPTGSITLSSGSYTSAATALSSGSATISIPAGSLAVGADTLKASYTGDTNYTSGTASTPVTVTLLMPTVSVTSSAQTITTAQALTITIAVAGASGQPTPTGSVTLSSGTYSTAATALASGSATVSIPAGSLAAGTDTISAAYTGDSNYATGSGTTSVIVSAPAGLTVSGTAVAIAPGATTGNTSTISVTPAGGLTGSVALTAAITTSPSGAVNLPTLSFGTTTPVNISGTTAATATLTISTTAATTSSLAYPQNNHAPWYSAGGAALACILLFGIPGRRRRWRTVLGFVFLLISVGGGITACGGGSKMTGTTTNPGTTAGTYVITVTATAGTVSSQGTVALTVQ